MKVCSSAVWRRLGHSLGFAVHTKIGWKMLQTENPIFACMVLACLTTVLALPTGEDDAYEKLTKPGTNTLSPGELVKWLV